MSPPPLRPLSLYVLHNGEPLSLSLSLSNILTKEDIEKHLVGILVVKVWD